MLGLRRRRRGGRTATMNSRCTLPTGIAAIMIGTTLFRFRFGRYLIIIIIIPVAVPTREIYKILLPPPARGRDSRLAVCRSEGTTALGGPVTLRERVFGKFGRHFGLFTPPPPPRHRAVAVAVFCARAKKKYEKKKKKIPKRTQGKMYSVKK